MPLWKAESFTPNSTQPFCANIGGKWPATQNLIAFLTTNIFAHAATIYLSNGSDAYLTVKSVYSALLWPVNAGDRAFHVLGRYLTRVFRWKMKIRDAFGGDKFEDAATSGAIAISVPLKFAPLLQGRWDTVSAHQRIVMLNNERFHWHGEKWEVPRNEYPTPFNVSHTFSRYVPYILPSDTRFPKYDNYRLAPRSSALPQAVAVIQIFLSIRQLYLQYNSSILKDGLSSPYLVVIPYILMSLMNLLASVLVGSYPQITMLPMQDESLPHDNEVYIGGYGREKPLRVLARRLPTIIPSNENSDPSAVLGSVP